jgi:hypothetical protein
MTEEEEVNEVVELLKTVEETLLKCKELLLETYNFIGELKGEVSIDDWGLMEKVSNLLGMDK